MKKRARNTDKISKLLIAILLFSSLLNIPQVAFSVASYVLSITVVSLPEEGNGAVNLAWTNNMNGPGEFRIERKKDTESYELVYSYTVEEDTDTEGDTLEWDDTEVVPGHVYAYRIFYYNEDTRSSTLYTKTSTVTMTEEKIPEKLTVIPALEKQIVLKWSYPGTYQYSTLIERKTGSNGDWEKIAIMEPGVTSYSNTVTSTTKQYYYRIRAIYATNVYSLPYPDKYGISSYSKLNTPENLSGYALSPTQVCLNWEDISNETAYVIERKEKNEKDFTVVDAVTASTTEWVDNELIADAWYVYRIQAVNGVSVSEYSDEVTIATICLEVPSDLEALAIDQARVELTWTDNSSIETGYEIWRKAGKSGDWLKYTYVYKNETKFVDEDISKDTIYYYKIRGRISDSNTFSAFSDEISVWVVSIIPPTEISYTVDSSRFIHLFWKDNSNNESGFIIERKADSDSSWSELMSLPANATSYTGILLSDSTTYIYRVRTFDKTDINATSYSEEILVSADLPNPPADLVLMPLSSNSIQLSWTDRSENEDGFVIERKAYSGSTYSEIGRTGANVALYINHNVNAGKYTYRVKAYNKIGSSSTTAEKSTETMKTVTFRDLLTISWAKNAVENLASRGVFPIHSDGNFHPYEKITRGEFISILIKTFHLEKVAVGSFYDVGPGHSYYDEIMAASKMGIIAGNNSNRFYPDRYITREEMAAFLTRTLNSTGKPLPYYDLSILDEFADRDDISEYALYSLASLRGKGFLNGKTGEEGTMRMGPKDVATRVEAALLIYRAIEQ